MTLKHKIALTFSFITTGILVLILGYVYLHSLNFERKEFQAKLHERADILIKTNLHHDEIGAEQLQRLRLEHLRSMKGEREFMMNLNDLAKGLELPDFLDSTFVQKVVHKGEAYCVDDREMATYGVKVHDDEGVFLVVVAAENEVVQKNLMDLRFTMIGLAIIYMLLVYSIGLSYASYALAPLQSMATKMKHIDTNTLNERLVEPIEQDEIWEVAHAFNRLMDRIDTAKKVQQNFISNASHELKNPLTAIMGEIDVTLQRERSSEDYRAAMLVIDQEANRLNRLTLRLLHLAETSYMDKAPLMQHVQLDEVVFSLIEDYRITHPSRSIVFDAVDMPEDAEHFTVNGNEQMLRIAISNLLDNALKFSSDVVTVSVRAQDDRPLVSVSDKGIGIPAEDIESLFIPFFRSDNARIVPGFGIGLPLVKRITDMHDADLQISSMYGEGTTFTILFLSGKPMAF